MRTIPASIGTACARRLRRATLAVVAATLLAGALLPGARAQGNPTLERSVKAAFLFKFLAYVDFPPGIQGEPGAPLSIGVAGSDEMALEVGRAVAGRTVNGHPVVVKALKEGDAPTAVHLLFLAGEEGVRTERWLKTAQQQGVLTVTEFESGLQHGSVINFRIVDERVRFEVSLEAAEKRGVKLSSRLLSVAFRVQKGGA